MERKQLMSKISRKMQQACWEALIDIVKLHESEVTRFTHGWKEEVEAIDVMDFIDCFTPTCRELIRHYSIRTPEFWANAIALRLSLTELAELRKRIKLVRELWKQRPRFGVNKYLSKVKE